MICTCVCVYHVFCIAYQCFKPLVTMLFFTSHFSRLNTNRKSMRVMITTSKPFVGLLTRSLQQLLLCRPTRLLCGNLSKIFARISAGFFLKVTIKCARVFLKRLLVASEMLRYKNYIVCTALISSFDTYLPICSLHMITWS